MESYERLLTLQIIPQGSSTTVFTKGMCIDGRLGYHNAMCIIVNAISVAGGKMAKPRGTLDPKERK